MLFSENKYDDDSVTFLPSSRLYLRAVSLHDLMLQCVCCVVCMIAFTLVTALTLPVVCVTLRLFSCNFVSK